MFKDIRLFFSNIEGTFRYLPITSKLKQVDNLKTVKLLEVGSGNWGIGEFLQKEVTCVDTSFNEELSKFNKPVRVSDASLPFPDNSFDYVVSVDMLEHLNKENRAKSVSEMIRVARKGIFIAVPEGKRAEEQDFYLAKLYKTVHGEDYPFLKEHIENKLPRREELIKIVESSARNLNKQVSVELENNFNLSLRKKMMEFWINKGIINKVVFKSFGLLIPLRNYLNKGDCYRVILEVRLMNGPKTG